MIYVFIVFAVLTFLSASYQMEKGLVKSSIGCLMSSAFWCFWIWVCLK